MDKSQLRVRPGFILGLASIFAFAYLVELLLPVPGKKEAQIISTRFEMKKIASVLYSSAASKGSLFDLDDNFILQAVFGTNTLSYSYRTNADGKIHDLWDTPYKIQIFNRTNFIIRSAGRNKVFGDSDDIIFDSASNDFGKP